MLDFLFSGAGMFFVDAVILVLLFLAIFGRQDVLFSPAGRIKRLTFWEGLVAWFLLNVLLAIIGISHSAASYYTLMSDYLGDTDHLWYHRLVMAYLVVWWLGSTWIFAMLCAKRWHDLNFSGWLAAANAGPLLLVGYAGCVFFDSIGLLMNQLLVSGQNSTTLQISQQISASTPVHATGLYLAGAVALALVAYLGLAQGDPGANTYGKSAA